jgi:hypothetical protein
MIRFSQLCALGLKCRGGKDSRAAIDFGTFGVYQQCYRHATNHRQYATAPQGINAVCIYVVFVISDVIIFLKCQTFRLRVDKDSISAGTYMHTYVIRFIDEKFNQRDNKICN